MQLKAPGWPWLLAHELRLAARASKGGLVVLVTLLGILSFFLHFGGWFVFRKFDPNHIVASRAIIVAGGFTWFCLFLNLALAFGLAVVALFERGDFDLLLSSPIRPRAVFVVRGLGVAMQSIAFTALFWLPFANGGVLNGYWRMLAGYPVLAAFGLGATGVAFAATLALVRAFGVRRAKVIAQVLGAIAGAAIFLVSQTANLVPAEMQREFASWMKSDAAQAWLGEHSPLWLPARALLGDPFAALVTVAVGLGLFMAVVFLCERVFLEGTRESEAAPSRARPASVTRGKFRSGLARVVIVKELRLLWRDPKLITQVLLQVLYLLPLIFIVMRRGTATDILAPVVILISATLAGNLAWMTVSGEEAPDLVRSAPVPGQKVLWLKVAAALVAPLAICVPFIVIYGMQSMAALAAFVLCLVGCLTTSAVVQVWNARPGSGRDLKKRMQSSKMTNLVEFMAAIGWAGACYALLQGLIWPALGGLVVGLAMPVLAWYFRRDPLASGAA